MSIEVSVASERESLDSPKTAESSQELRSNFVPKLLIEGSAQGGVSAPGCLAFPSK
jgi:hypothetical protein